MAKTDKESILEFLAGQPDEKADGKDIAAAIGKTSTVTNATLSPMFQLGLLERTDPGVYKITDKGKQVIGLTPQPVSVAVAVATDPSDPMRDSNSLPTPANAPALPSEYDKFMEIGKTLGLKDDFNKLITETIFRGDSHNLSWVWNQLNSAYLRPDVTKRWFNIWSTTINQVAPPDIAKQTLPPSNTDAVKANEASPSKFSIIGDEIVPDPEGDYTFSQARQMLLTKAITKQNPSMSGDSVSSIIGAITPLLGGNGPTPEQEEHKTILATLLEHALSKTTPATPQNSLLDMVAALKAIEELKQMGKPAEGVSQPKNALEQLSESLAVMAKLKDLFTPPVSASSAATTQSITVPVTGADGQVVGAIPLSTLFEIQDHQRKVKREEEEFTSKQETGKVIRNFLGNLSSAAQNFSQRT
jgi:hypothetical protein